MGLFDLFKKRPLTLDKIEKSAKLAANPYAQPDVRMREMQRLLDEGTAAALGGVLKRFAANAQGHIADEDEKKWLEDSLVEFGEDALAPLGEYIGTQQQLSYALHAYRRIAGQERACAFFLSVLTHYGPDDYRSGDAKVQIIAQVAEHLDDPKVLPALAPFITDHSDEVRWAVMDVMVRALEQKLLSTELTASVAERIAELAANRDTGPRIQRRAAELLADREWPVPGDAETLGALLDDDFFIDKKRYVRRRAKKRTEATPTK